MRKQIDLTTLPGWANLSTGNHTIKIKAKGTGYKESELSAGVVVSKAASTFTLEKGTYKWKDTTSLPNTNIIQSFDFTSKPYNSNVDFEKVTIETSGYIRYSTKQSSLDSFYRRPDGNWVTQNSEGDEEITIGLQTITLSTDQQVSPAFYKWAITDGNLVKQATVYTDCLTFTGETSEFTLKATNKTWDGTLQWSTDHNTWTTLTGTEAMQSVGKKLYLRGKSNTTFFENRSGVRWQLSAKAGCSGNIQTLLDWENPPTSIPADSCYRQMFYECTNLTSAPELPATTLASYCYDTMFNACTSLTTAPELPATTLSDICYSGMFYGCSKLKVNTSAGNKIFTCPSTIPDFAVDNMFLGTGGSFKGTPTAGNTYYWTE